MQSLLDEAIQKAILVHQAGDLENAEKLYRAILDVQPSHSDANHNLGVLAISTGRQELGIKLFKEALVSNPTRAIFWIDYISSLIDAGSLIDAQDALVGAIKAGVSPADLIDIENRLIKPESQDFNFQSIADGGDGKSEPKNEYKSLNKSPLPNEIYDLSLSFNSGEFNATKIKADNLIKKYPGHPFAWKVLGAILKTYGHLDSALFSMNKARDLDPKDPETHYNLGVINQHIGRLNEAEKCYLQAIHFKSDLFEAYGNLGTVQINLHRSKEAEVNYKHAIAINPNYADAHFNLGNLYRDMGKMDEALSSHNKAKQLNPSEFYLYKTQLLLPDIYTSSSDMLYWRDRYKLGLNQLREVPHRITDPTKVPNPLIFNLAYHNQPNLTFLKLRSELAREKVEGLNYSSQHTKSWKKPTSKKIKIGFCSEYLVAHTIGLLNQGLIKLLDRSIFEVVLIYMPKSKHDEFRTNCERNADKVIQLNYSIPIQHETISKEQLDILFFPEIGMSSETYHLAHARLAPIQIVSWGHPDTTGIDTVDYFISSQLIEPDCADQQYSERLVKFSRLPCYYDKPTESIASEDRANLGLPTSGTLYGCLQSPFKLHPDFDAILAEIVAKDPSASLIFIEGQNPVWSDLLKQRWASHCPILNDRAIFLPRRPTNEFMALLNTMDVLLDPIHFGSGNTFYESMICGVPTVTWPGQFMRGRVVSGAYKQMGIMDAPIANQLADYADIAVRLGSDPQQRMDLKKRLQTAAKEHLYADASIIQEFEKFFLAAIDAADKGVKLEANWTQH